MSRIISVDERLLIEAFDALAAELHHPTEDHECDRCHVMFKIEQAVGRKLGEDYENEIVALISVPTRE